MGSCAMTTTNSSVDIDLPSWKGQGLCIQDSFLKYIRSVNKGWDLRTLLEIKGVCAPSSAHFYGHICLTSPEHYFLTRYNGFHIHILAILSIVSCGYYCSSFRTDILSLNSISFSWSYIFNVLFWDIYSVLSYSVGNLWTVFLLTISVFLIYC